MLNLLLLSLLRMLVYVPIML
jgi:hypothetical protein